MFAPQATFCYSGRAYVSRIPTVDRARPARVWPAARPGGGADGAGPAAQARVVGGVATPIPTGLPAAAGRGAGAGGNRIPGPPRPAHDARRRGAAANIARGGGDGGAGRGGPGGSGGGGGGRPAAA